MARFTDEEIEEGLRFYFMPEREYRRMTDFDRMVVVPSKKRAFEVGAPEMLLQMWNDRQRASKTAAKREAVHG